ncbi:MAG TPA: DNA mismatch repair endonuclease MutL [Oligoflexia bacterium]|nr:DNA mismatch repair endonuclease MutL [Oligoflexia bacterium]HMP27561.1 DNA mismatch repair endonuclease MutL [Oligoflexia bacterium]
MEQPTKNLNLNKIISLPDELINKIAAGEVIDRPASVVRELVDNAIDAGADEINIEIEGGGKLLIKVTDNGKGIAKEDLKFACERHTTSKISRFEDLYSLSTFGFRGEALASIASVSKFKITSATAEIKIAEQDEKYEGASVEIDGGVFGELKSTTRKIGTTVEIRHLFFNAPARKKFLKEDKTEELKIKRWLLQFALTSPNAKLELIADGKKVFDLAPQKDRIARGRQILTGNFAEIQSSALGYQAIGLIGHPHNCDSKGENLVIILNNRVIQDRTLIRAIKDGFGGTLKEREYPVGFISLTIPQTEVDINVHPQKSEVRFADSQKIYLFARRAVNEALASFSMPIRSDQSSEHLLNHFSGSQVKNEIRQQLFATSNYRTKERFALSKSGAFQLSSEQPKNSWRFSDDLDSNLHFENTLLENQSEQNQTLFGNLHCIGVVLNCYAICENQQGMVIVDLHAAHERINYNRLRKKLLQGGESQALLMAEELALPEENLLILSKYKHLIDKLGFNFEIIKNDRIKINSLPAILHQADLKSLFYELSSDELAPLYAGTFEKIVDQIAARAACHASFRSGEKVSKIEISELLKMMDGEDFALACPHGRPTVIVIPLKELESRFGRQ